MKIHVLDMGEKKFGDSILVTHRGKTILVDGGHQGDGPAILNQLRTHLEAEPPFRVDLLVVTHAHSDHIGCLPELVRDGNLTAAHALVADENLGWGILSGSTDAADAGLTDGQRMLAAGLREEDHTDLPDDELRQFLTDAATLRSRYREMLAKLQRDDTVIVRYGRDTAAAVRGIETKFRTFGLKVLGPTTDHLLACARRMAGLPTDSAARAAVDDPVAAYRRLAAPAAGVDAADGDRPGAAINNQSIVLKVGTARWAALLTGDMQFARAEVPGLTAAMTALRRKVREAGPYSFVKLPHHTSDNAVNAELLDEWDAAEVLAHSGGVRDARHPDGDALRELRVWVEAREEPVAFLRTDRSGTLVASPEGVEPVPDDEVNDFSVNVIPDAPPPPPADEPPPPPTEWAPPPPPAGPATDSVEVITRVPHTDTEVTITIRVEPGGKKKALTGEPAAPPPPPAGAGAFRLGGGRPLPPLLFVTCGERLAANVGRAEAAAVRAAVTAPAVLLDLPAAGLTAESAAAAVRAGLAAGRFAGVVIVGGYDVVPAHRLDVLDAVTRQRIRADHGGLADPDDFVVWSDDPYADLDGGADRIPDLPVTRVPDGRRAGVLPAALSAAAFAPGRRFGVRNVQRPFAEDVFARVPGAGRALEVSEAFGPERFPADGGHGAVYYLLHGLADDPSRFRGGDATGATEDDTCDAVAVRNVPRSARGTVVFTGCCWGALTATPPAGGLSAADPLRPHGPDAAISVAYLRAGAVGFVGCTGAHYSPPKPDPDFNYFGKPLHDAFWAEVAAGRAPAEALFRAKQAYARAIPHGRRGPQERAVELKTFRQFTCLGLGW